jgi:hypothetical protein
MEETPPEGNYIRADDGSVFILGAKPLVKAIKGDQMQPLQPPGR